MHKESLRFNWKWFVLFGVVSIGLGVMALTLPTVFSVSLDVLIGLILVGNGTFQALETFKGHDKKDYFMSMGTAILEIGIGGWMLLHPIEGIDLLSWVIAIVFASEGIFKLYWAKDIRPDATWQWLAINGVIAIIFGVLIGFQILGTERRTITLLMGLNLFANGLTLFLVGMMNRLSGVEGGGDVQIPVPTADHDENKEEPQEESPPAAIPVSDEKKENAEDQ